MMCKDPKMLYSILDIFFCLFHTILIFFNLFGWLFTKVHKLHICIITATLLSWIGLGFFYGWGYCFLTDWHFQVLYKLGETNLPQSYITYLVSRFLGWRLDDNMVANWTGFVFVFILIASYSKWMYVKFRTRV